MKRRREEEWDWPPRRMRRRGFGYVRAYRTFDVARPYGANTWGQKVARGYIRFMLAVFKIAIAIPCTILVIGGVWFLGFLLTLYW
jgi:hypothetical protein